MACLSSNKLENLTTLSPGQVRSLNRFSLARLGTWLRSALARLRSLTTLSPGHVGDLVTFSLARLGSLTRLSPGHVGDLVTFSLARLGNLTRLSPGQGQIAIHREACIILLHWPFCWPSFSWSYLLRGANN